MSELTIDSVVSPEELVALQKDWERLSAGSLESSLYQQPDLLALWWRHFGKDVHRPLLLKRGIEVVAQAGAIESPLVMVARLEGEVVGILPLMWVQARPRGSKALCRCLTFLGDPIFMPTPTITVRCDLQDEVLRGFAEHLQATSGWDVLFLAPIRSDQGVLEKFLQILTEIFSKDVFRSKIGEVCFLQHWDRKKVALLLHRLMEAGGDDKGLKSVQQTLVAMDEYTFSKTCLERLTPNIVAALSVYGCPDQSCRGIISALERQMAQVVPYVYQVIALPKTYEEYVVSLSSRKQYEMRKDTKTCLEEGITVGFEKELSEDDLRTFMRLHCMNHPRSAHINELTLAYYRELIELLTGRGCVTWVVARKRGAPLSFVLLFYREGDGRSAAIINGRDQSFDVRNIGECCLMAAIEKSIEMGCSFFDLRMGDEVYKKRLHPEVFELEYCIVSRDDREPTTLLPQQWTAI